MDSPLTWLVIILVFIAIIIICSTIKIVPQAHAYVIERLGTYCGTWSVGLHMKMPIIDKIARRVTLKEQVVDFAPQPVITKDNVTMRIILSFSSRSQIQSFSAMVLKIRSWQSKT